MNKQNNFTITSKNRNISFIETMSKIFKNYLVIFTIIVLVIITGIIEPRFVSLQNVTNLISQIGCLSLVALGMTIAIIGGYIDLSVVGIINIVAVTTTTLIDPIGQVPALIVGLCLGAVLGLFNSFVIMTAGATSMFEALFITFGLSAVYNALALIICQGQTIQLFFLKTDTTLFTTIGTGMIGIFSLPFILFIIILAVLHIFLTKTYLGRTITLTGGNKTAALLAGISVKKTTMLIFSISGLLAGLTGIVLFTRVAKALPSIGDGYDMQAILAVVVGGTTLAGGKGSVLRTLMGLVLIALLSNCMNLLGVSPYMKVMLTGIVLILAIWLDNRKETRREFK